MAITAEAVKALREKTGAGMMDCKNALQEANGDFEKAIEYLRKKGASIAQKRSDKVANQGVIESYIHTGGRVGTLIELNCETDFVAKTDDFKRLARDLAMQVAAMNPRYVSRDDVHVKEIEKEVEIYKIQAKNEGKPDNIAEKIAQGRLEKYYQEVCLLEQSFIKDSSKTVKDLLNEATAKIGENIRVSRFQTFHLGENSNS
jgi:elongation factor Ts